MSQNRCQKTTNWEKSASEERGSQTLPHPPGLCAVLTLPRWCLSGCLQRPALHGPWALEINGFHPLSRGLPCSGSAAAGEPEGTRLRNQRAFSTHCSSGTAPVTARKPQCLQRPHPCCPGSASLDAGGGPGQGSLRGPGKRLCLLVSVLVHERTQVGLVSTKL